MADPSWGRAARGVFLELRLIPVLLWSYTAVALGTAMAFAESGRLDGLWLGVALALGLLIQGFTTHAVNDIYDWRSGTDRHGSARALSGGSKVLNAGLLDERGLWAVFWVASGTCAALAALVGIARSPWLVLVVGLGYAIGVAYTAPPLATSYRPFAGEWLGGFPGVLLAGLGAYGIQALTLTWTAVVALSAHALVCTGMLLMHGYLDETADAHAVPRKATAIHALGRGGTVGYATAVVAVGAALYLALGVLVHLAFLVGVACTVPAAVVHASTRRWDLRSVTWNELKIIQLGIAAGLGSALLLAPALWPLAPIAAAGYVAHLAAASPPAGLARAWLPHIRLPLRSRRGTSK
jgi:1,4-dihydroxy-2-naphthoate octaprenyltransferase